ncbi:MAG: hypothetical protein LBD60_01915 [Puniceicoccales bacterium]|jgi:hypothetical protein|nr:hypothetical protein [Puniceicoccales bacterium]
MDNIRNNVDNVSRLRDGKINNQKDFPFGAEQASKVENFDALKLHATEAAQDGSTVNDREMERFFNDITSKSTTTEELHLANDVVQQLAQHPEVLSEKGQSLLMDAIPNIAKHRNSDHSMAHEGQETLSEVSKHLSQLGEEAQEKFFKNVESLASDDSTDWRAQIATNIAHANDNGIDDITETAQDPYIHLFGNTAQEIFSLSPEKQAQFQQAAVELMQKTQFPIKFDADSFREALSAIPENARTTAYNAQLAEFEANIPLPSDVAEIPEVPSENITPSDVVEIPEVPYTIPEIPQTYTSEVAEIPVEVLPQALPIAPESLRASSPAKPDTQAEELEENFATAQAE